MFLGEVAYCKSPSKETRDKLWDALGMELAGAGETLWPFPEPRPRWTLWGNAGVTEKWSLWTMFSFALWAPQRQTGAFYMSFSRQGLLYTKTLTNH